ncbi:MAG: signal peptidase II [Bdellovibrionaceae bacterium]|nr:signal peptidase II [Pseudobdellovibrionaceae bacterium]
MKKRDWLLVILPMVLTIGIDQLTKLWALDLTGTRQYGILGLSLHYNKGAMLGLFSSLPPILRIVSLSTGGAFLLFTYVIIQYLLPIKSLLLRVGMSILMGGILGNVIDRTIAGAVVDFIFFSIGNWNSPVLNIADALQWVGYICLVTALLKDGELLWPQNNLRKFYWINPKYQLKYCLTLMLIGVGFALIAGVFSYTFLRFMVVDLIGNNKKMLNQFLIPFVQTFAAFTFAFAAFLFLIGRVLSHRVAGPVYAFERFVNDFIQGKGKQLKLRKGDEFANLEALAQLITEHLEIRSSKPEALPILPTGEANKPLSQSDSPSILQVS